MLFVLGLLGISGPILKLLTLLMLGLDSRSFLK